MKTDLIRLNVLCFMAAVGCFGLLLIGQTGTLPLLALIIIQTIGASLIVSRGASRQMHKTTRRAIFREKPSLTWRLIGLSLGVPVLLGLAAFYILKTGFDSALLIFLGTSYLSQILVNLMLLPHIQKHFSSAFD